VAKLLTLISITMLPKNSDIKINSYLHSNELDCHCARKTCHYTLYNSEMAVAFYKLRGAFGKSLNINSAFRCQKHNKAIGGVAKSSHTTGNALDISLDGLDAKEVKRLKILAKKLFDYVKVYDTFFHLQINPK
jgi:hypothetical protein